MAFERLSVNPERPARASLARIARILREGGVVAYPTETFYALGANALDARACDRVYAIKGRSSVKALPVIVSGLEQLERVGGADGIPSAARELARRFWPGPLTLIVPCRPGIPAAAGGESLAVRVSGLVLARQLAEAAGVPITSTSANRSGAPAASTADEVARALGSDLQLLADGGETPGGAPSTIVDLSRGRPHLVREGPVAFSRVLDALRS